MFNSLSNTENDTITENIGKCLNHTHSSETQNAHVPRIPLVLSTSSHKPDAQCMSPSHAPPYSERH